MKLEVTVDWARWALGAGVHRYPCWRPASWMVYLYVGPVECAYDLRLGRTR